MLSCVSAPVPHFGGFGCCKKYIFLEFIYELSWGKFKLNFLDHYLWTMNMLNTEIQFLKCWFKFKVLFYETGVGATPLVLGSGSAILNTDTIPLKLLWMEKDLRHQVCVQNSCCCCCLNNSFWYKCNLQKWTLAKVAKNKPALNIYMKKCVL